MTVILRTNIVIFKTNLFKFSTNPVMFRTSPVVCRKNSVILMIFLSNLGQINVYYDQSGHS